MWLDINSLGVFIITGSSAHSRLFFLEIVNEKFRANAAKHLNVFSKPQVGICSVSCKYISLTFLW